MYITYFTFNIAVAALVATAIFLITKIVLLSKRARKWEARFNSVIRKNISINEVVDSITDKIEVKEPFEEKYKNRLIRFRNDVAGEFVNKAEIISKKWTEEISNQIFSICEKSVSNIERDNMCALPENTKYFFRMENKALVLIEKPAGIRDTHFTEEALLYFDSKARQKEKYSHSFDEHAIYKFKLSFPYTLFLLEFDLSFNQKRLEGFRVFFKNAPLKKLNETISYAPFLNTPSDGNVCSGWYANSIINDMSYSNRSISEICDEAVSLWINSAFHSDLNVRPFEKSPLGNISKWEKNSLLNPFWACKIDWTKYEKSTTPRDLIRKRLLNFSSLSRHCKMCMNDITYKTNKELMNEIKKIEIEKKMSEEIITDDFEKTLKSELTNLTHKVIQKITL